MRTIQMTIDEGLLDSVDEAVVTLNTNRSAFIRDALELALRRVKIRQLEQQQADGYARQPMAKGEFEVWESEQVWGE